MKYSILLMVLISTFLLFGCTINLPGGKGSSKKATDNCPPNPDFTKFKLNKKDYVISKNEKCPPSMAYIPPGTFMMGSPKTEFGRFGFVKDVDYETLHKVTLTSGYCIGKFEVTQGLWKEIMGYNPSDFQSCGPECPVQMVTREDIMKFIKKLNKKFKTDYRLPTDAEWEYAARAGTTTPYYTGENSDTMNCELDKNLDVAGWYCGNSDVDYCGCINLDNTEGVKVCKGLHPVGLKKPNKWGLYDMHGNVWELVADGFSILSEDDAVDPLIPYDYDRDKEITRGGSWFNPSVMSRSSSRMVHQPGKKNFNSGFRLALSVK